LCLKRVPLDKRLRLLGVRVGTLQPADALNLSPESALGLQSSSRKARHADLHTAPLF
jgi:DNA polymerase-4